MFGAKFAESCAPKSVVLISEFFVEPIIDERVAEVVDEEKIAKLFIQLEDVDNDDAQVRSDEAECD